MAATIYALLVGIDSYQHPVRPLQGCVADIEAMHTFLESRVGVGEVKLDVLVLKNEEATYAAVIEKFRDHLGQAGAGDTALFCFNGHGSQAPTAAEFLYLEPDGLDETLVCYDSRNPGKFDLADKEISKLIADVAKNDAHVVIILDSCHSGTATRSLENPGVRRVSTDNRQRPVSSYYVNPLELQGLTQTRGVTESQSGWMKLPRGKHVVLSACEADEEAKEDSFDGQLRGVFSYYLMETLQNAASTWTYRDLYSRVTSMVRAIVSNQSPVIEATDFSDLDRPFLGGAVQSQRSYFTASYVEREGWVIDGGSIHGIAAMEQDDTTLLAIFPVEARLEDTAQAIGSASVKVTQPTRSTVDIQLNDGNEPDDQSIYKAIVTSLPVAALGVKLEGDAGAVQLVRDVLNGAAGSTPNSQIRELENGAELQLVARDNRYTIRRAGDNRPLGVVSAVVEGWSPGDARKVVEKLEHIGRWIRMARLHNPTSKLPSNAVSMDVYRLGKNGEWETFGVAGKDTDRRVYYEYRDGEWQQPIIKIRIKNNSKQQLYCMLFDLTDSFEVAAQLITSGGIMLEPEQEKWVWDDHEPLCEIPMEVPDKEWESKMTEYTDLFKLVACTEKCDASRFEQDSLDIRYEPPATTRGVNSFNSLEQYMQRNMTRKAGGSSNAPKKFADWTTCDFDITTVRPLEGVSVPLAGEVRSLSSRISLQGHPGLKANVRLSTVPLASRDMTGAPQLPGWLRDDPNQVQPFDLSPVRGVESGLSVLELDDVSGFESVTPEQPLTLQLGTNLGPDEHLLTVAYDQESNLYLPLGLATRVESGVEIRIERLPTPASSSRSLTGSIKIFFQKIICKKLGREFEYPLLAATDAKGTVIHDRNELAARVAASSKILLYVHGITGDTSDMVKSAFKPVDPAQKPLAEHYDLVLSFDYENLNTTIEDNAAALKARLEQVGLGADHGKTLHVVAHSMGGLVSRWFIENLEGNKVVQHLVMLGTPNGGSPWSKLEDLVVAAIGVGLNRLATIIWPVEILARLMGMFEKAVGVSLSQMEKDSVFLQNLAGSADPGVQYSIIAGNTSIIASALATQGTEGTSRIGSLFKKLNLQRVMHSTASLAFFGAPNDIAADVTSITHLPVFEKLDPTREVACDHMSYFVTEAGLRALYDALT